MLWQLQILPCSSRSAIQWSILIWNTLHTCSLLDSISFEWFVHLFLSVSLAPPFSLCVPFCVFPRRHDATLALHLNIVGPLAMEVAFSLQVRNILYLLRASMIFAIYSRSLFVSIIQTLLYPISFQTVIFLLPFSLSVHSFLSECASAANVAWRMRPTVRESTTGWKNLPLRRLTK